MTAWNAMTYEGKDTILRVVAAQAEGFFDLAGDPGTWTAQTACPSWQVRDVVGHLVDTTESYFVAFDAARSGASVDPAYGLPGMAARADLQARALRTESQEALLDRLRADLSKMREIFDGLSPEDWGGLLVPHFYMGPLPAFFYPAFQLMDYGVHSWDIREGTGRAHALSGDAADLLVPFMFVLWQSTASVGPETEPGEIGIRITSGHNAGDHVAHVGPDGLTLEPGPVDGLRTVLEFDAGSLVLTAFGRCSAGTVRGDAREAERFLNLFFRI
ncbi:MAG: maleylpyruvate isomerase family mycothiol-dependent enzyme [Actinomycetes bacterium]